MHVHICHTAARALRSSTPARGRAPCHSIVLYSEGCVRNTFAHVSPKPTETSSRKATESEDTPAETTPRRGHSMKCRGTALKSQAQRTHARSNTDKRTTRASPHCFLKEAKEFSEDDVVSNGDGFRSGSPIQQSVHTRWSRHPYYHSLEIPYVY